MAKRDTKNIEAMLANTRDSIELVREEMKAGASLQHVYDDLNAHERLLVARLKEIADWNKSQEAQANLKNQVAADAKAKADAEALEKAEAKAKADAEAAAQAQTDADALTGPKSWLEKYKNANKKTLLAVQADTAKVLAEEPNRVDAKSCNEAVTELLKKFN